jgi:hypothetical protein
MAPVVVGAPIRRTASHAGLLDQELHLQMLGACHSLDALQRNVWLVLADPAG